MARHTNREGTTWLSAKTQQSFTAQQKSLLSSTTGQNQCTLSPSQHRPVRHLAPMQGLGRSSESEGAAIVVIHLSEPGLLAWMRMALADLTCLTVAAHWRPLSPLNRSVRKTLSHYYTLGLAMICGSVGQQSPAVVAFVEMAARIIQATGECLFTQPGMTIVPDPVGNVRSLLLKAERHVESQDHLAVRLRLA